MTSPYYPFFYTYLGEHVLSPFYTERLRKLKRLKLNDILRRKNPYLFKAKNIELAGDFVKEAVNAFLSSQEETMFGNLLEGFAIYVCETVYNGFKSRFKSIDLEFQIQETHYIVSIKSGINWGNADQISKLKDNFKDARRTLRENGVVGPIVAINGCIYGQDSHLLKANTSCETGQ